MGEEHSRSLVHQHGAHCPAILKTATWFLSCLNDHKDIFIFKVLAHRVRSRCLHVSAPYKFTFKFTLHYGKNGCVLQRLIRLVFVLIGLFRSIKQWDQFHNYTLYKKKVNHLRLHTNFPPKTLTCCTIYPIKFLKLYGMCLLFKTENCAV